MKGLKKVNVSIITPVAATDEAYIRSCGASVAAQIQTGIEWILIVEQESALITEQVKDIQLVNQHLEIRVLEAKNAGLYAKRNQGIQYAQGEYIYFLDVDDRLHEHTLYILMESATSEVIGYDIILGALKETTFQKDIDSPTYNILLKRLLDNRISKPVTLAEKKYRISALNTLFRKDLIAKHDIFFDEDKVGYADVIFTTQAYKATKSPVVYEKDALYQKYVRNDPIKNPSVNQELDGSIYYPIGMADAIASLTEENATLKAELVTKFLKAYQFKYLNQIYSQDEGNETKNVWASSFKKIGLNNIQFARAIHEKEVRFLIEGKYSKATKLANRRIFFRTLKKVMKKPKTLNRVLYQSFLSKKTNVKNNVILYESFLGRNYSDSPKYIYEYLNKHYPNKYKHIWVFNDPSRIEPTGVTKVKRFSFKHMYYMAKAKYHVNNMRQPKWFIKRPKQVFLATWHGTPLKKLVFDMNDVHSANPNYKKDFYDQSRAWDYLVSANHYSTKIFKSAFLFDNHILEYGYPRNDLLYADNKDQLAAEFKVRLCVPQDKKVVLYAPTWRDDEFYKPGQYKFKLQLDLNRLKEKLGDEYFFLIRTHYFIADKLDFTGVEDFVLNVSDYDDITELYLISDVLITDYSSVFFDYANLKRPILFFTYDLEKYRDTLRGFYLDLETEAPGPLLIQQKMLNALDCLDETKQKYATILEEFHNVYCHLDDGQASKHIAEKVIVKNK
ncbi:bifunctional glycosyltransferase/CDP-glycerol:glycerophosphate glycerophosphotransferase [Shouchella lehensis]|uniref:CDP-glycerol:poly(Glycerophosphate) glycerophosphotransferase n=1 Tax=Shouchella lehensis G1 TaxID=1246626 RepID=A0A060M0U2_9BACI|nr:CDP-glycerol glycerophosphotransferase family protein [Shouchella lehensis]AIC95635.1 CDP-glycerol:poly(glycerophosphate) glycerophosphotransferase [Shouchella lehensis G1]